MALVVQALSMRLVQPVPEVQGAMSAVVSRWIGAGSNSRGLWPTMTVFRCERGQQLSSSVLGWRLQEVRLSPTEQRMRWLSWMRGGVLRSGLRRGGICGAGHWLHWGSPVKRSELPARRSGSCLILLHFGI